MHDSILQLILKLPILKPHVQSHYQMFALPRADPNTMLLTPTEFYSNKVWYDKCTLHREKSYICTNPRPRNCSLKHQTTSCLHVELMPPMDFYKVTQNFVVITETPKHWDALLRSVRCKPQLHCRHSALSAPTSCAARANTDVPYPVRRNTRTRRHSPPYQK